MKKELGSVGFREDFLEVMSPEAAWFEGFESSRPSVKATHEMRIHKQVRADDQIIILNQSRS